MALKKDKQKVIGPDMTDEQIRVFLQYEPPAHANADFHVLERAYRSLRAGDFRRFLDMFSEEGRDINATNSEGETLLSIVSRHESCDDYARHLKDHGAT